MYYHRFELKPTFTVVVVPPQKGGEFFNGQFLTIIPDYESISKTLMKGCGNAQRGNSLIFSPPFHVKFLLRTVAREPGRERWTPTWPQAPLYLECCSRRVPAVVFDSKNLIKIKSGRKLSECCGEITKERETRDERRENDVWIYGSGFPSSECLQ